MDLLHARKALGRPMDTPSASRTVSGKRSESLLPSARSRDISIALGLIVIVGVARVTPPLAGQRALVAWLAALVFAVAFPLTTLRPMLPVVWLCGLCGVAMQAISLGATSILMVVVAIIQASRFDTPLAPVAAMTIGFGYEAASAATRPLDPSGLLSSAAGLTFAYFAASGYRRLREEKRKTETLLQEVLAGRDAQVRAAALDERARIAREIHDILAHTLSALAVQLEGTRLLVEQRPGDPAALSALERAGGLARDGLEETKRAVGALRGDALPGPEELPRRAADFERDTGVPCRLSVAGEPVALSPEARLALYRTAQEALTNVRKHANALAVAIRLRYDTREAELTVENQGAPRPRLAPMTGGGHGLEGMRERAELARGRLEVGPTPTGFKVRLWLPM